MADDNNGELFANRDPLALGEIIESVLKFVTWKDMKTCRQLSSKWNGVAEGLLRKRTNLRLRLDGDGSRNRRFLKDLKSADAFFFVPSILRLENRIGEEVHNLTNSPYNFSDNYSSPEGYCQEFHKTIVEICGILGNRGMIRILEIDFWEEDNASFYAGYFTKILQKLSPCLEVLDIDDLPNNAVEFQFNEVNLYAKTMEEFGQFPLSKLKKIVLPSEEGDDEMKSIFRSDWLKLILTTTDSLTSFETNHKGQCLSLLEDFKNWGRLAKLKSLRLEFLNNAQLTALLETPNLSLEELKIHTIDRTIRPEKFNKLIKLQSLKMKRLVLGSPTNDDKMTLKLPPLPELTRLGLYHCDESLIFLKDLRFSRDTPKLKSLEVSNGVRELDWKEYLSYESNVDSEGQPYICKTVEELTVVVLVNDREFCPYIGSVFPNVKTITLNCPRTIFLQQLWTTWDLVELNLFFHDNARNKDNLLFGIPVDWISDADIDTTRPEWWANLTLPQPMPSSICNLKNLRRLTIEESPNSRGSNSLTDLSVYFGFAKLSDLRTLKIGKSNITTNAIQYLKSTLPLINEIDIRGKDGPGVLSEEEQRELLGYVDYYRVQHNGVNIENEDLSNDDSDTSEEDDNDEDESESLSDSE